MAKKTKKALVKKLTLNLERPDQPQKADNYVSAFMGEDRPPNRSEIFKEQVITRLKSDQNFRVEILNELGLLTQENQTQTRPAFRPPTSAD